MSTNTYSSFLIKGAIVLTMDDKIGDFLSGDVLVEGDKISRVGAAIVPPAGTQIIEGSGKIVIPGLVNAHMHTWQTALRGVTSNLTLSQYFRLMHAGLATLFEPEDIRIGTLAGALGQLNAGTTTLGDWCHNNPTPAHTDAAIAGLVDSGIRAVFLHGSPKPDPKADEPHFSEIPHPRSEIERLLPRFTKDPDSLVTLGMAILGPHYSTLDVARADLKLAREYDLMVSAHQGGAEPKSPGGWETLEAEGFLGPRLNLVHGNDLTDEQISRFTRAGVTFSITPEVELTMGHGWPITDRVLAAGGQPSYGVDIESVVSADMFTVARMALGCQRGLDRGRSREAGREIPDGNSVTTRDALEWITLNGARALGLDSRTGSLTPGKQADIVILDATAWNMLPVHDPYSTVIMQANIGNVQDVIVAGKFKKLAGHLRCPDAEKIKSELAASGRRIVSQLAIPNQIRERTSSKGLAYRVKSNENGAGRTDGIRC
jgi:5-methylthioadenosine/S-adenosylhomocysteine deaminase